MKAITVRPHGAGARVEHVEIKEKGMKVRIIENGICGTDREIVKGLMSAATVPENYDFLVLGHEALGILEDDTDNLKRGTIVMPINRRGCNKCINCLNGRADFCETDDFVEAGIKGMHGFMREYIYDDPNYLVPVPPQIRDIAIMAQPLSDLEKSVAEMIDVQGRLHWRCIDATYGCRKMLVTGTGTIGILISMLLKTYGFDVSIANRREPTDVETRIFEEVGLKFVNTSAHRDDEKYDGVIEASGSDASVIEYAIRRLKNNGFLGLFGFIRSGTLSLSPVDLQSLVYRSISITGLINGQKPHFETAINHLVQWKTQYPFTTSHFITRSVNISDQKSVLNVLENRIPGEIKTKILW
ncbi:alcohol dehydrogenase [Thermoplasma sp. Kam2015]|uniref:glucose 1-dehydrogenase n=1 Tax=Thermoplasma sp. Kam2015 TaxID=2094122 RepID=UPI000D9C9899|nr:glucose 1-dehydrogenase [Thermoplasma sp. Kam2015]PYB68488.1 alcohol dehydrogenase [Thermoplasma sp. Kam2015]